MSNKKSKCRGEEKEKILKDKRENELTYREVIEKYKVSKNTVKNWERIYKEDGVLGLYEERRGVATKETSLRLQESSFMFITPFFLNVLDLAPTSLL
jgi:transposase